MKKVFFSLMLIAALAFSFTSCKKTTSESETHSQTFTLGETSYDINNAVTIENIQYQGSDVYNAIVVYTGSQTSQTGGEGKGVAILFKGNISTGTHHFTGNAEDYPKYVFADLSVTDVINFDITQLLDNDEAYIATSGSLTLAISNGTYTITTNGIEVENAANVNNTETSSVDYEGTMQNYVLATVQEGTLNNDNIVTAGATKLQIMMFEQKIVCFITDAGDMIGFIYQGDEIPTGTIENANIIYIHEMNLNALQMGTSTITIEANEDVYTVNIEDVTISGEHYTLHYVGTLPFFDLPI